ncbi:MAG: NAD(P)-binding domain-containing protein [Acidobacteria bacterium]|jgi:predicted dinucleotide-binding enzyme|nr:NAD(P)-binding domain-containing protein [Acidobacteriota bacterium]
MKIGIIGAGNIGANAAKLFVKAGHEIAIANSRGAETLKDLVAELGENAQAVSIEEAAKFSEIVFISIPFGKYQTLPPNAFDSKIVVDSNNYYPDRDGSFTELDENKTTSSEMLAEHLRGARIVKGFNTIWFEHLKTQGDMSLPSEERRAIFIASDDAEAKKTVARLIEEIGFAAVDTGDLRDGGATQQPDTAIYNRNLTASEAQAILGSEGGY